MQARALLGGVAYSTYRAWKTGPEHTRLSQDGLTRISLLLGTFKALRIYFGKPWADLWVTLAGHGPLFGGRSPIEFLIRHGQPGMTEVRRMLDSWHGGR